MPIKISKVANDLNVGIPTLVEFLQKHNQEVGDPGNLNLRISDEQHEMLVRAFKNDKDLKSKSERYASERQKDKVKNKTSQEPKKPEQIKTVVETVQKPKILGKIELDKHNNPVVEEKKPEPKPAPAPAPAPKPAPKPEPKPEVKKEVKEEVKKAEVKEEAKPAPQPAPQPQSAPKAAVSEVSESNEIKTVVATIAAPKILGKIDLDAINQSTRPKKKSKEEKRKERIAKEKQANGGANADSEKRKRKRIGKEKVDIEHPGGQQAGGQKQGGGNNDSRRNKNKNADRPNNKAKRHIKAEVSEEDVQKQVKETLARLTNKPQKKSAKWRKEKREAFEEREREEAALEAKESKTLRITEFVTANDLALMMDVPVNKVIATCMNIGVMVSINQRLDAETINLVAEEFGFKTEYISAEVSEAINEEADSEEDLLPRPPIVTVMGHVDHGKTSLLDYIRNANVIAGEAGGITQHIGAYNVKLEDGRRITFLDTPGHEAFTAMRARGAKVTDIAIIIVAADDNVMPQTIEAINHASAAGVPIVFAINKIDKPAANPDKIKEELANMNYLVEDWGGKYQSQEISAKKGIGVKELLDKVLLEAEMLDLKANPNRKATGSIIESSLDKGRGYVATVLVSNGTLRVGDIMVAGTSYGKIRAMFNERNQRITEAGPAAPALVLGLNGAPTAGDTFNILDTDREAREIATRREQLQREVKERTRRMPGLDDIARRRALGEFHELNLIVKGDVDGSIEALSDSLIKLSTPEVQVNVIHKAVGAISESDVTLAAASDAVIIGFQVRPSVAARRLAENDGVDIRLYSIIYDAIEEVKDAMAGMLSPELKEEVTGTAEVLQTYKISKVGTIAGCMVREGKVKRTSKVRLIRDGIVIYTGELGSLKRFKDDVKEVSSGYDCGLNIANYNDVKEGDMIEAYEEVEVSKTL
jgi:translation initiation factor IF-2